MCEKDRDKEIAKKKKSQFTAVLPTQREGEFSETKRTKNIRYPKLMHINWHAARPCVKIFNKNTDNNEVAVVSIAHESFWVAWFLGSLYISPFILNSVDDSMTRTRHCCRSCSVGVLWIPQCGLSCHIQTPPVQNTAYDNSEKCIVRFSHIPTHRKIITKINPQMLNLLFHVDERQRRKKR